ncbi:hypothetical protein [Roseovarius sp.]|uniref:hypothetical protein n=1 Tax=Roseovarius sp. TaxID=1486281 RepID=UPI003BAB008D
MIRILALIALVFAGAPALSQSGARDFPLAMNLSEINDWSTGQPFIDVFKTARRWIGHKPGQWGGVEFDELEERGLLDAQGWPTSVPHDLGSIGTLILTDLPDDADIYAGRYVLSFEGEGIVEVGGAASNVRYGDGQVAFDFQPGTGRMVLIKIQRSDPMKTGDYIRNITVVREEHQEAFASGAIFNPLWLDHMQGFAALRFMDWMHTNNSDQQDWANRPKPDDFSYTRHGAPAEIMIALANELGADPWFCMPHLSDENYQRRFAEMVEARLDPGLKAYVEYSNEVWNWQFTQAEWAEARAQERWGQRYKGQDYYGMKTAQMAEIWADVFADARNRLVTVIATQTGWLGLERAILDAPLWVAEGNEPPHTFADAYAITGYFGSYLGRDEMRDITLAKIAESSEAAEAEARQQGLTGEALAAHVAAHRFDKATDWAVDALTNSLQYGDEFDGLDRAADTFFTYQAEVAREYGLDLIVYEGGTHLVGVGAQVGDDTLTAFFTHFNYTPEIATLYRTLFEKWAEVSDGPFALFNDVGVPVKWGSWGHLRHLGDAENPRWQVVDEFK